MHQLISEVRNAPKRLTEKKSVCCSNPAALGPRSLSGRRRSTLAPNILPSSSSSSSSSPSSRSLHGRHAAPAPRRGAAVCRRVRRGSAGGARAHRAVLRGPREAESSRAGQRARSPAAAHDHHGCVCLQAAGRPLNGQRGGTDPPPDTPSRVLQTLDPSAPSGYGLCFPQPLVYIDLSKTARLFFEFPAQLCFSSATVQKMNSLLNTLQKWSWLHCTVYIAILKVTKMSTNQL